MQLPDRNKLQELINSCRYGEDLANFFIATFFERFMEAYKAEGEKDPYYFGKSIFLVIRFFIKAEIAFFSSTDYQGNALREWKKQNDDEVISYFFSFFKGKSNDFFLKNPLHLDKYSKFMVMYWLDTEPIKLSDYDLEDPRWAELTFDEDWYRDPDKGKWNVGK